MRPEAPSPGAASERQRREAERDRALELLADDRAGSLIPSIRSKEIAERGPDGKPGRLIRAPSVETGNWRDPHDMTPNASKQPRRIRFSRRANNLRHLRKKKVQLSDEMVVAGALYEMDFERAHIGCFPGAPPPEIRGTPGPGDYTRFVALDRDFRRAEAAIGPMGADLLRHVVLGRYGSPPADISSWAESRTVCGRPLRTATAVGMLILVLDLLVAHYGKRIAQAMKAQD